MSEDAVVQILKAINDFRDEFRDEKKKNEKRWEKNEKRWEENEKRWEQNDKRWEENEKRWLGLKNEIKRNRDEIKEILWSFQTSVEQMYKENSQRITKIEQLCPKCNVKAI